MAARLLQLRKKFQTKTADCDPTALNISCDFQDKDMS